MAVIFISRDPLLVVGEFWGRISTNQPSMVLEISQTRPLQRALSLWESYGEKNFGSWRRSNFKNYFDEISLQKRLYRQGSKFWDRSPDSLCPRPPRFGSVRRNDAQNERSGVLSAFASQSFRAIGSFYIFIRKRRIRRSDQRSFHGGRRLLGKTIWAEGIDRQNRVATRAIASHPFGNDQADAEARSNIC